MKAADEINVLLVDAVYYDITDSARLQAKWKKQKNGGVDRTWPFISLSEIPSRRQLGRAHRFIDEQE